ncbi:MAG TPA: hypothetical protein VMR62_15475, partial [Bryobacteraceae bacterium]|nr:hypothetical protein [Bryobacteraceae bacterium]
IIYRMLKFKEAYVDKGKEFYEQKYRQIQLRMLQRKAAELGLQITEATKSRQWVSGERAGRDFSPA